MLQPTVSVQVNSGQATFSELSLTGPPEVPIDINIIAHWNQSGMVLPLNVTTRILPRCIPGANIMWTLRVNMLCVPRLFS